jgi:predicted lipoprotein with Yx(FWY)xxD motif
MKKIIAAIVIVIVVAGGAYSIFHKSSGSDSDKGAGSSAPAKTAGQDEAPDVNNGVLTTKTDSKLGKYLADPDGKALYTYDADSKGVSNCTDACLAAWPAYVAKGSTKNLPEGVSTIKRKDNGQTQYAYNGLPLYYFVSDGKGQVTGDGVDNFSIAKPADTGSSSQPSGTENPSPAPSPGYDY